MEGFNTKRTKGGFNVKDVSTDDFIKAYAEHLKRTGKVQQPEWSDIVKTGCGEELAPSDPDWFYVRAASLARRLYVQPNEGLRTLRNRYSKMQSKGSQPDKRVPASGKIIRVILQQLQTAGLVKKSGNASDGRSLTKDGYKDLDIIATEVGRKN